MEMGTSIVYNRFAETRRIIEQGTKNYRIWISDSSANENGFSRLLFQ